MKYLLALGLLGTAIASPHARPAPQDQQEIDPNPSLTYSLRDPEVTEFQTQNGTDSSSPTASPTSGAGSATQPTITEIASFTVPNGGIYTAIAVGGTARIAGRVLTVGGPDALVGGVRVSAASDGFRFGDRTAAYASVTGSSTVEVVSTVTDEQGSSSTVSSSSTVAVAESSATESASATESGSEDASSTGSAAESSSTTGGAAGGATARSKAAFTALGGLTVLLCVFA